MKSHFHFSNKERNGIFLLLIIIIALQYVYAFIDISPRPIQIDSQELNCYRAELDSLRALKIENDKPKIYPFNPNFISDYKGYTLGMSNEEIDRLHRFRDSNNWINSIKQFQEVTNISDSLLDKISPYFKFPDWMTQNKSRLKEFENNKSDKNRLKTFDEKIDLNKATIIELQAVYGIGEKLSERIVRYRETHKGFVADVELEEIYGLTSEVIQNIKNHFTVKTPRAIQSHNLNEITRDQLVTIPHIDYEIAHHILEERTLRYGFKSIDDLTKVEQFPVKKLAIIKLYLHL